MQSGAIRSVHAGSRRSVSNFWKSRARRERYVARSEGEAITLCFTFRSSFAHTVLERNLWKRCGY